MLNFVIIRNNRKYNHSILNKNFIWKIDWNLFSEKLNGLFESVKIGQTAEITQHSVYLDNEVKL